MNSNRSYFGAKGGGGVAAGGGGRGGGNVAAAAASVAAAGGGRLARGSRGGWRADAIAPWDDCDVDEDGKQVCPDDFYLGALSGRSYRDWTFPEAAGGRYVYRQWDTGDIHILETPRKGRLKVMIVVPRGSKAWRSISSAIYARKAGKKQAVVNSFAKVASTAAALMAAKNAPQEVQPVQAAPESEIVETPLPEASEPASFPWVWVVVGGGALGAIVAIFGGRK